MLTNTTLLGLQFVIMTSRRVLVCWWISNKSTCLKPEAMKTNDITFIATNLNQGLPLTWYNPYPTDQTQITNLFVNPSHHLSSLFPLSNSDFAMPQSKNLSSCNRRTWNQGYPKRAQIRKKFLGGSDWLSFHVDPNWSQCRQGGERGSSQSSLGISVSSTWPVSSPVMSWTLCTAEVGGKQVSRLCVRETSHPNAHNESQILARGGLSDSTISVNDILITWIDSS